MKLHRDRSRQYVRKTVVEFEALLCLLSLHLNELLSCFAGFFLLYHMTSVEHLIGRIETHETLIGTRTDK